MTLKDAKDRVDVLSLWGRYGFEGTPGKSCCSPFREDRHPSFSVYDSGRRWKDYGTGAGGDAINFIEHAEGITNSEACRKILQLAGGHTPAPRRLPPDKQKEKPPATLSIPDADYSKVKRDALAELRNVSPEAIDLCVERGLLRFAKWKSKSSWVFTDREQINAQARRLDGRKWQPSGAKALTLPGSQASWPIGLREAEQFPVILLVEGGPDLLAAAHFIYCEGREKDATSVAMLGASHKLNSDALLSLCSKRVRIFCHNDSSGKAATTRWGNQLKRVDAIVDAISFEGLKRIDEAPVKDLNDLCYIHADDFEKHDTKI